MLLNEGVLNINTSGAKNVKAGSHPYLPIGSFFNYYVWLESVDIEISKIHRGDMSSIDLQSVDIEISKIHGADMPSRDPTPAGPCVMCPVMSCFLITFHGCEVKLPVLHSPLDSWRGVL